MVVLKTYRARARKCEGGWELHVEKVGVTQVRTLDRARQQASDLIETMTGASVPADTIDLHLDLGGLQDQAAKARSLLNEAERLREEASGAIREVARDLREAGLSVTDIDTVLEVSRARVSQYLAEAM